MSGASPTQVSMHFGAHAVGRAGAVTSEAALLCRRAGSPEQEPARSLLRSSRAFTLPLASPALTTLLPCPARDHQVLRLYRRILKAAQRFPSIKRDAVIAEIKGQFREHRVRGWVGGWGRWEGSCGG